MSATVSILLPCYNAEPWVAQALDCALEQTYPHTEIIALDDGSIDGTLGVLEKYRKHAQIISTPNRGTPAARNLLESRATGEWIQHLDADDLIDPTKIEEQMDLVAQRPCDLVVAPARQNGVDIKGPDHPDPWVCVFRGHLGITVSNLWRRETCLLAGGWTPGVPSSQDYDLLARMLAVGARVEVLPIARSEHRVVNPQSITNRDYDRVLYQHCMVTSEAVETLRRLGQLTDERRMEAARCVFDTAQRLWPRLRQDSRRLERLAIGIAPEFRDEIVSRGRVYGMLYGRLGFGAAQRYDRLAQGFRNRLL